MRGKRSTALKITPHPSPLLRFKCSLVPEERELDQENGKRYLNCQKQNRRTPFDEPHEAKRPQTARQYWVFTKSYRPHAFASQPENNP